MTAAPAVDGCEVEADGEGDRPGMLGMLNEAERTWCTCEEDDDEDDDDEGVASAGDGDGVHIVVAVLITTADLPVLTGMAGEAVAAAVAGVGGTGDEDGLMRCVVGPGEPDESGGSASGDGEAGSAWCEKVDDCEAVDCELVERVENSPGRGVCYCALTSRTAEAAAACVFWAVWWW